MKTSNSKTRSSITSHRFFFPAAALHAAITVWLWLLVQHEQIGPPTILPPGLWHAQELIFGYAFAVIAGYLLPSLSKRYLLGLLLLWVLARCAWFMGSILSAEAIIVIACAFPIALSLLGASRFKAAKRSRNLAFSIILLMLGVMASGFYLLTYLGFTQLIYQMIYGVIFLATIFICLMGGRIIPPATVGALRDLGFQERIPFQPKHETLSLTFATLLFVCELTKIPDTWSGIAALALATTLLSRMRSWQTLRILQKLETWPLHLGYLWFAAGLAAFGLARIGFLENTLGALHLVTLGGIGTITLTMQIRVTHQRQRHWRLGNNWQYAIQGLLIAAVITRFLSGESIGVSTEIALLLSTACWSLAFLLFLLLSLPAHFGARAPKQPRAQE